VSPPVIGLVFEPTARKTIPLSMRIQGQLRSQLALSSPLVLSPESVVVRGPESALRRLTSLRMEPFDLGQVTESGVFDLAVDTSGLAGSAVEPQHAVLGVGVEPLEERVLSDVPVQADAGLAEDVLFEPASVGLRLVGARTLVTSMDLSLLRVVVVPESLRDLVPGEMRRVRLQVEGLPPLITAFPSSETVTVRSGVEESDRP
jgi:hypothetical protein